MFVMYRAVNGTRTRDIRLGKPTLYQLSYYRIIKKRSFRKYLWYNQERPLSFFRLKSKMEPITRLELVTHALRMRCSTN